MTTLTVENKIFAFAIVIAINIYVYLIASNSKNY